MNEFATVFSLYNNKQTFISCRIGMYNGNPFQRIVDPELVKQKWEGGPPIDNGRSDDSFFIFMQPFYKLDFQLDIQ